MTNARSHYAVNHAIDEAVALYRRQSQQLGEEFEREVVRAIVKVLDHPMMWPRISGKFRRCRMKKFSYGIVYRICDDELFIVAFMYLYGRLVERDCV